MIRAALRTLVLLACLVPTGALHAQELSVLPPAETRWIEQEVSGDAAFEHVRHMTQFHRPRGGHDGVLAVARYFEERAREIGLADVRLILQPARNRPWNARSAELWIVGDRPERVASTLQTPVHLADHSRAADVTAELVDVGAGEERDYEGRELAGKLVLTHGPLGGVMREAVQRRGAAGVIWYPSPFARGNGIDGGGPTRPDQIRWMSIASADPEDGELGTPTFAFVLSLNQGLALRERIAAADGPLRARATVDAAFDSSQGTEPWQVMVEAVLPGADPEARQDVVLTGHLQEEGTSANDDASGCASTLEVARALHALVESGRIPRPKRDIRFWFVTEISSQRQYFADHPEEIGELWLNVNQDMVGADQSQDILRKQCITRLPATRFHFLNDVMESVVEHVVASNNFELAQLQNGIALYPNPHVAHRGSWHRWNAAPIFFHNNTDHMTFTEAPIGIPGLTFTNMPDRFIHSSDDDLWNIDATQLGRSAAAVALIAYTVASADAPLLPRLEAEVVGRGEERLARNLRIALSGIALGGADPRAFHAGIDQVRYAADRERLALRSLADAGASGERVAGLLAALAGREAAALERLESARRNGGGGEALPERELSEAATRLAGLRPRVSGGPRDFLERRGDIAEVPGLHSLMAFEVLNACDGNRSGLEIARLVAGEAREAGAHYYGVVTDEAVLAYLEGAAETGLVELE